VKLLLAMDESTYSQEALRAVLRQFQPKGSEVRVLHVVEPVSAYVSADLYPHLVTQIAEVEVSRHKQAKQLVSSSARELASAGFKTSEMVEAGSPTQKIMDLAHEWGADLIVLGSHGLTGLNRLLMGSVSDAVSRHASCSVEVVRLAANAAANPAAKSTAPKSTAKAKKSR
jgi:nucleotide-binding universal stress UspA family protein